MAKERQIPLGGKNVRTVSATLVKNAFQKVSTVPPYSTQAEAWKRR